MDPQEMSSQESSPSEDSDSSSQWEDVDSSENEFHYSAFLCPCGLHHQYQSDSDAYDTFDDDDDSDQSDEHGPCIPDYCDGCSNCEEGTPSRIPGSCPYWECSWPDVPLTSSGVTLSPTFIQLPQHIKAIRLGVGSFTLHGLKYVNVYCYLNHLEKQMGWVIQAVTCFYEPEKFVELKTCWTDDRGGELLAVSIPDRPKDEGVITLKFRFYLSGSTNSYDYDLHDVRHGEDLWEAAVDQQMTDVEFLVGDRSFPAHKFLLAARSPVFSVMFGTDMVESRTGRVKVDDADPDTFQQFLRYLYNGHLEEPASEELAIIADKYDVKTLTAVCESAEFTFGAEADELFASVRSAIAAHPSSGPPLLPFSDQKMAANFWKCENETSIPEGPSWAVCEERGHSLLASLFIRSGSDYFHGDVNHFFRGNFIMPDQICLSGDRPDQDAFRIAEVFCSSKRCIMMDEDHRYFTRMKPLNDPTGSEDGEPAMQTFTATPHPADLPRIVEDSDVTIEFHVCHTPSIPEFRYAFRDWRLIGNLWRSALNKEWTDIDFQVEDKTFSAHRALLTARCPALIPPGSNDSSASVRIENVEASAFKDLLHFLYTGELKTVPPSEALYKAAVTYKVDLLKRLYEMKHPKNLVDIWPGIRDLIDN